MTTLKDMALDEQLRLTAAMADPASAATLLLPADDDADERSEVRWILAVLTVGVLALAMTVTAILVFANAIGGAPR